MHERKEETGNSLTFRFPTALSQCALPLNSSQMSGKENVGALIPDQETDHLRVLKQKDDEGPHDLAGC